MNLKKEGFFTDLNKKCHDRKNFDCKEDSLNKFLKTTATQEAKNGVSRTIVFQENYSQEKKLFEIKAFFSIAPTSIKSEDYKNATNTNITRHLNVGAYLLCRIAVDKKYQSQGYGKIMLIKALETIYEVNKKIPGVAVIVEPLNKKVQTFYERIGFQHLSENKFFLSMKKVITLIETRNQK